MNNAGIGGTSAPTGEYPIDDWQKVIGINLSGVFYGMKYQLPEIVKAGSGSVINTASILGQVGFENSAAYVASKHGVVGLTKSAAVEYAKKNVRVNSIGPGFIYTGLVNEATMGKEALTFLEQKHAVGRLGTAERLLSSFYSLHLTRPPSSPELTIQSMAATSQCKPNVNGRK